MQRFKKLGVFLHDCPADGAALAYAGVWGELAQSESVLAMHVSESSDHPDFDEARFRQEVAERLPQAIADRTEIRIVQGSGVPEILRCARDIEFDMIIVGRRMPSEQLGIGTAFARLARKAPCNVLVVPSGARPHLERIFVPVDFSEHSKMALEQGIAIGRAAKGDNPQLLVHTNFKVGYGYSKTGKSFSQAISERQAAAEKELREFLQSHDTTGYDVECLATSARELETAVMEVAVARKMDLIVVGSRGTGGVFMLGSAAERIILHSLLPVLVVKKKGETRQIIDALFGN